MTDRPQFAETSPDDSDAMRSRAHADIYGDVAGYHQQGRLPGPAGEPKPYQPATGRAGRAAADWIDRQEAEAQRDRTAYDLKDRPSDDQVNYGKNKLRELRESLQPSEHIQLHKLQPDETKPPATDTPEQPKLPF